MSLAVEIKRKVFHHLSLIYLLLYAFTPVKVVTLLFGLILIILGVVEFIRIRRPEINAWFLAKFGGIHRESEILAPSGIFWTLLGSWTTMVIFTNRKIVLASLGFLVFGDAVAAIGGKAWGKHPWASNPKKTMEGSACFVVVSALWAMLFLRWPVAILGSLTGAWVEAKEYRWNDNFWVPILSGVAISAFNLVLGR